MKAAHFINRREDGKLIGLQLVDAKKHTYSSEAWKLSEAEAEALVGGWIYLHAAKSEGASFGGQISAVELTEAENEGRYRIHFEAKTQARGKPWDGQHHSMAWWSGVIEESNSSQ